MRKRIYRLAALACMMGSLMQFAGCLSSGTAKRFVIDGVTMQAFEFLLDNNTVIDLFTDN